jgi:hypothetical protein
MSVTMARCRIDGTMLADLVMIGKAAYSTIVAIAVLVAGLVWRGTG